MTPELDRLPEIISTAVGQVHSIEPYAAADLAAWVLGDLLCRVSDARKEPEHRYDVAIGCAGIYDAIEGHQESWFMPYLMEGFDGVRESGGQDLFARWSHGVL